MLRKFVAPLAFLMTLAASIVGARAACSVPNTLTNGTTADATAVYGNFTSLAGCAAPLASPAFTGSVLVGTTTSGGWSGTAKLESLQNTGGWALSAYNSDTAASGGGALLVRVNSTNNPYFALFAYNGTIAGSITTNGTTTSYNTTSDERLKDWKIPQQDYSSIIRNMWVGDFKWKSSGISDFGYRAQQTYSLFPTSVHKPVDPTGQWEMDYGKTAALAVWGVKDLYAKLDDQRLAVTNTQVDVSALRVEIAALRAQVESLERSARVRSAAR